MRRIIAKLADAETAPRHRLMPRAKATPSGDADQGGVDREPDGLDQPRRCTSGSRRTEFTGSANYHRQEKPRKYGLGMPVVERLPSTTGIPRPSGRGFSWRRYFADPVNSVLHNPELHAAVIQTVRLSVYTTLICVPLGVAFALGINRWRGAVSASANFAMILSFVIPELIFGVALFFVFTQLFTFVGLGTWAEVFGLVTWNISWPAIIVQARLVTIGKQYEEAAADLGATPMQTMRRVMLPLLTPAIFASAVLVFSGVIDDFVIVDLLNSNAANTPMSVYIYSQQHGGNGGPALNALGTIMLVMSFVIAIVGYLGYRWMTRGERGSGR